MNLPCIITALPSESRTFIEHFKLQARNINGLQVYVGDRTLLLQTGIGKLAAAAKVAALLQECSEILGIINIGIAGCDAPLGTQLVAGCVEDAGSQKRWYPHLPPIRSLPNIKAITVQTHDKPELHYQKSMAFDMEAAGIFSAARGKLDSSAVHSIKVVSDNSANSVSAIDKAQVHNWMAACIPTVDSMINYLDDPTLKPKQQVDEHVKTIQQKLHFTTTQTHQLHRLVTQHLTLRGTLPVYCHSDTTAKALLFRLKSEVACVSLQYH